MLRKLYTSCIIIPLTMQLEVRCPFMWESQNDLCTSRVEVDPITECKGFRNMHAWELLSEYTSEIPGICQRMDYSGVNISCPDNYQLKSESEESDLSYCVASKDASNCKDPGSCMHNSIIYPSFSCPEGRSLIVVPNRDNTKKSVYECTTTVYVKGKVLCPEGFMIENEPFPFVPSDSPIAGPPAPTDPVATCVHRVAVPHQNCNKFNCKVNAMKNIKEILIDWYINYNMGSAESAFLAIPNGNNLKFTAKRRN